MYTYLHVMLVCPQEYMRVCVRACVWRLEVDSEYHAHSVFTAFTKKGSLGQLSHSAGLVRLVFLNCPNLVTF